MALSPSTRMHSGEEFSTTELTLKMDDFSQRVIEPAVAVIAADIVSRRRAARTAEQLTEYYAKQALDRRRTGR